jgi:poly(hydroxyalkanoate) granule-associated protein
MAKKKTRKAPGPNVAASAHAIWLAGLGAFAAAEREGAKVFKSLVELGEEYDADLRGEVGKASTRLKSEATKARSRAESTWKRLESGVGDQITAALHRLNVPTRSEIAALRRKVEDLTKKLEKQGPKKASRKKAASRKKTTAKKKSARKKATGRTAR